MDSQEILRALQEGKISLEDAEEKLKNKIKTVKEQSSTLHLSKLSRNQHYSVQSSRRFHKRGKESHELMKQEKNERESGGKQQQVDLSRLGDHYGLVLSTVHSLNELSLQQWVVPEPNHDEVTIQVKASAINFPDTMCVKGLYPTMPDYPFVPGFEVSGIVSKVGIQVSEFDVGDEVIAITGKQMGGHAGYVNVPMTNIVHKPKNISFEEACSLPVVFGTVFYAFEEGKLATKEHVLIQTATGGCGLIAIQLARLKGCVCYGTSSKQEKLDILKKLELPYVINYKTSEFDREIKQITNDRGVDVVLNMLSGDGIQKGINCLGPSGRYLEIAVHALKTSQKLDLSKLVQNQSIYSIDLRQLSFLKSSINVKEILNLMVSMIQSGEIVPIVSRIYPVHQIKEALEYVGRGQHVGKVVISHTHQTMIDITDHCIQRMLEQKRSCESIPYKTNIKTTSSVIIEKQEEQIKEGIAIIGMSGQFPKSKTLDEFWSNLARSRDCISEIPSTRWSLDQYYDPDPKAPGKTYSKWMGVLDDVDKFDPSFFNISPAEAEYMDPQQRLFLESCWRCIEDAGLSPASLSGSRCGVFVGCGTGDYGQFMGSQGLNAQALMGGTTSILSARISYLLNLTGPCLAIDTACSSSLVAIAEACNSLLLHNSDLVLAGGVCVMAGPSMHIMTSKAGMLSKDGRCFTFDNRANGFVPGEGVGVVLLKRLSDAVRDQDPIYGVIRGWGINQDGKTNGITAPSVSSQIHLEKEVYERFGFNPETISLVEAHGTGTKLGDPIEVEALTGSFQSFTHKNNYCALGSVKSNIGHLMTAAGVSGVIKVLLALKHRMLPPTIHYETLNEHISLDNSPFYINTKLKPWEVSPGIPRRACVSSFGFSGTNAHIAIEEYIPKTEIVRTPLIINTNKPIIFILSAKSEEQLIVYAEYMKSWIEAHEDVNLEDMAYTIQVGREAMDYRLAFVADSRKEVLKALEGFVNNNLKAGVLTGQVKKNKDGVIIFEADEDGIVLLQTWIKKGKYNKIAELWVHGLNLDWNRLYTDIRPRRINLPTYPFARERYWISDSKNIVSSNIATNTIIASSIHPLLHQNTSDLSEQRFSSTFTGKEFFLLDHVVGGQLVLPRVACLEMARAAVDLAAAGALKEGQTGIRLKNVVWARPIVVGNQPVQIHIGLYPEDNGEIAYEIYSESEAVDVESVVYSQGIAVPRVAIEAPTLDIKALQAQCAQGTLSSAQCYETFKAMGIGYGPGYQGIEKVYVGAGQALAKLSLPYSVSDTQNQFVLHPSLMDSALQALIGLMMGKGDTMLSDSEILLKPSLHLDVQELEVLGSCKPNMWALVRYSEGSKVDDKVHKLDIVLCDDQGTICVRMNGFSSRMLEEEESLVGASTRGMLMFQPSWDEQVIAREATVPAYTEHLVMLCEQSEISRESIEKQMNGVRCLSLQCQQKCIGERFQIYAAQVFEEIQSILKNKPKGQVLIQIIVSTENKQQPFFGLSGLLKTAQLENPKLIGQLIAVEPECDFEGIIAKLKENSQSPMDKEIRYSGGKRYVAGWSELEVAQGTETIPWKDQGIYLITGGAGGLGLIFAKEIVDRVKGTTLILTGRSPLKEAKRAQLKELETLGTRIEYKQVDVTQKEAVVNLIQSIKGEFGSIDGIIHSAGVIRDNFILKKCKEELQEVLAPKVIGLVNLDQVSNDLSLDFFIVFSSGAGAMGNIGQADYSTANAFMDSYARYRNTLMVSKQRRGQTLSVNWPLWKEGGMQIDQETEKTMMQRMGIIAMQTSTGIQALYQGLVSGKDQVMIMEGNPSRMRECLLDIASNVHSHSIMESILQVDQGILKEKTVHQLKVIFGEITKINVAKIDVHEPLESYGIDSIMITQLNSKLGNFFGELSKTLFFEYQTLGSLADYLITDYPQECMKWTGLGNQVPSKPKLSSVGLKFEDEPPMLASLKGGKTTKRSFASTSPNNRDREPIAIIGISGRYPQAQNLDEYWENLKAGKNCITEIPKERWSLEGFYHPDRQEAVTQGKSYSKWGGFVDGFANFDPLFFNISPREAINMDPQERLFIESCWKVFEDAGYTKELLAAQNNRRVGVFAGITKTGFDLYGPDLWKQGEKVFPQTLFSSVANRISYLLNLQGPSMPIDTMCSSSLTAIHEACEHLHHGECEMAIAGGVNLYLHPSSYIGLCAQNMLSEDGACKSFGRGGDGFVPGEGVGVILLKRLSQAVIDEDHIYAVIRGTSINHGGKTNGYTVPNPTAQGEVIKEAMVKAGVNARSISYIEAHGTGTRLGDPIEVTGMTQAFQKDTKDTGFCAIGSVKSNIGHLEAAAGIAGVTKVILQMNNEKFVPSLQAKELNPNINFPKTPFVVQQELAEWKRPIVEINGETKEYPRIAGISSFGAGGANAHIIIEEYIPNNQQERPSIMITPLNPVIIVLSAKNEERLKEQAQLLLTAIQQQKISDNNLADMAYTLQVGREAMEERVAMLVGSIKEFKEKLKDFVEGQDGIEHLYRGQVKRNKETLAFFIADEELQEAMEKWIHRKKYLKILEFWVKGLNLDWNKLYCNIKPRRISLPTYPFARECYWVPKIETKAVGNTTVVNSIHPLLHQNTSDLSEQRFSSTFTGEEFFLSGHVVKGQRVLPGVAYLEMARAAVDLAAGVSEEGQTGIRLKNVVWARPIVVGDRPIQVHIGLYPEDTGEIAFEVYCESEEDDTESVIYSQGKAVRSSGAEVPTLDLFALQAQCSQNILSSTQCYTAYKAMGIDCAPGYQGIQKLYVGSDCILAKLSVPNFILETQDQFVLHPCLLESALQASIYLGDISSRTYFKPILPFALLDVEIIGSCTPVMWALIRYNDGSQTGDKIQKLDIDLCDETGRICVRMKDLCCQEESE